MALQPSGEFKLEQHGAHDGRRGSGHPDQIIEQNRAGSEQIDNARAVAGRGVDIQRLIIIRFAEFVLSLIRLIAPAGPCTAS